MVETDEFAPVSWAEVRDHLVRRLMIDAEWMAETESSLSWWPTPLVMHIEVIEEDQFPNSHENWIQVRATMPIASFDEERGRVIASEYSPDFPVGAVVFSDGELSLQTIFSLNPRNRGLLSWFHESILIQSATALSIAVSLQETEGATITQLPHPVSGFRSGVDELVRVYGGEAFGMEIDEHVLKLFEWIRPELRELMIDFGYQLGFSNDEVDFFNWGFASDDPGNPLGNGAFDVGVGFMRGTKLEERFGPSLVLVARLLPPGIAFDDLQASYANEDLSKLPQVSLFGRATGGPDAEVQGSTLTGMVPYNTLREWSYGWESGDFSVNVFNAVTHLTAAAQMFRREVLNIHWPVEPMTEDPGAGND